jgi:nicotinate-nucleotide pyrophosphorylase
VKSLAGWFSQRVVILKAIIAGGAECHRLGLFDTIMLFDEHRPFLTKAE